MAHPDFIACSFMENSTGPKCVNVRTNFSTIHCQDHSCYTALLKNPLVPKVLMFV